VAALVHRYVEKPLMNLFKKRREKANEIGAPLAAAVSPSLLPVE